jgi:hypothetical protein
MKEKEMDKAEKSGIYSNIGGKRQNGILFHQFIQFFKCQTSLPEN